MRRIISVLIIAFYSSTFIPDVYGEGILTKSGVLTRDEAWSGTVIVTGDVTVPKGVTLTIEPGTIVKFETEDDQSKFARQHGRSFKCELIVKGILVAKGTPEKMIVFTSNAENPKEGDWYGIRFEEGYEDSLCILDYCRIEYAKNPIYKPSPLNIKNHIVIDSGRRSPKKIFLIGQELLNGTLMGIAIASLFTGLLILTLKRVTSVGSYFYEVGCAALGTGIGYPLGSAIGVYKVEKEYSRCSFVSALIGAYLPLIAGYIAVKSKIVDPDEISLGPAGVAGAILLPPLCAVIGLNITARPKDSSHALLNIENGKVNLNPPVSIIQNLKSMDGENHLRYSIKLIEIKF